MSTLTLSIMSSLPLQGNLNCLGGKLCPFRCLIYTRLYDSSFLFSLPEKQSIILVTSITVLTLIIFTLVHEFVFVFSSNKFFQQESGDSPHQSVLPDANQTIAYI